MLCRTRALLYAQRTQGIPALALPTDARRLTPEADAAEMHRPHRQDRPTQASPPPYSVMFARRSHEARPPQADRRQGYPPGRTPARDAPAAEPSAERRPFRPPSRPRPTTRFRPTFSPPKNNSRIPLTSPQGVLSYQWNRSLCYACFRSEPQSGCVVRVPAYNGAGSYSPRRRSPLFRENTP